MSDITKELQSLVGFPESETLEYKAVLPPSKLIAQIISSFANSKGGVLILGILNSPRGSEIKGLSEEFQANAITQKAVALLSPSPRVEHQYFSYKKKEVVWNKGTCL